MLRCAKYCAMGMVTFLLFLMFVGTSFAAIEAEQTFVDSTWSNTIYYLASLQGEAGYTQGYDEDVIVHITAVNEYQLYINGTLIGSDNNWETVETYNVNVNKAKTLNVAVKVINYGKGNGNGLLMDFSAAGGNDQFATWTKIRASETILDELKEVPVAWWTFDEATKNDPTKLDFGDNWFDFDPTLWANTAKTSLMRRAMVGNMGKVNYTFIPQAEVITGYVHTDVDIGFAENGGISLRRIEGENIALKKPAKDYKITDGDLISSYTFQSSALDQSQDVDLGRIYRVNKMTIFTGGGVPSNYSTKSFRGYAVEISLDKFRWEEVGVIHDIGAPDQNGDVNEGGYDNYSVEFPPEWVRYIQYVFTEARTDPPIIAEVMVFGQGHILEAKFISDWKDMGSPAVPKNFGLVTWDGIVPDGTSLKLQFQTKIGANAAENDWSEWSEALSKKEFMFNAPEPATHVRYRVILNTQDTFRTPVFKNIAIKYSADNQPVTSAQGYITPTIVAMGADSTFTYHLNYGLTAGDGIKEIAISVPGFATLKSVRSTATGSELINGVDTGKSTPDTLFITFNTPLTEADNAGNNTLEISFNTKVYGTSHVFDAFLSNSSNNDGVGAIRVWENKELGSNTVIVSTLIKNIISDVKAIPKVFTPNNDNVNDFTVIEFTLAKVQTDVMVKIFSTDGHLVTTITDEFLVGSDYRIPDDQKKNADMSQITKLPGYWDGKNEDGDLVPPGIYIYQVVADTDEGDVVEGGTVVVAY